MWNFIQEENLTIHSIQQLLLRMKMFMFRAKSGKLNGTKSDIMAVYFIK